jgi:ketosteroid isomerase-like protein
MRPRAVATSEGQSMRSLIVALAFAVLALASGPSRAQDELQAELTGVLERYYAAQRAGDFDAWMAVCSEEFRGMVASGFSSEEEKQAFLEWQKQATPGRFEVLHLEPGADDGTATLYTVADGKRPPATPDGEWVDAQAEVDVSFVKEADGWKVAMVLVGADPSTIQRSDDESFEPLEAYDTNTQTSLGGSIVRTEFKDDHTLVVVRLMDEEELVYLPSRQELIDVGFDPDLLVPHATVEVEGHPHRSDKFKVWATGLNIM